jgi:hypothetical protein
VGTALTRAHGAERVVLVQDRYAEDGHDRVANELLDRASVALDLMEIVDGRRHLMKRIAVVIGIVIGVAATPAVVTADSSSQSKRDRYELAST